MKKALSIFLCMLICLPLLAGCTDNGTAENGAETGTEATADTSVGSESVSTADAPKLIGIKIDGNDMAGYVIVKPADASESEAFAAEELAAYIEKACGAKLEILTDTASAKTITLLRDTSGELGGEGFLIKTEDGKVTSPAEMCAAVCTARMSFLKAAISAGDSCPYGQEYLKTEGTVEIADGIEDKQIPVMEYRQCWWTPYLTQLGSETFISSYSSVMRQADSAKQKLNGSVYEAKYGGPVERSGSGHTFGDLANGAHSFDEQPCLTDETVYQNMLAGVLKQCQAGNKKIAVGTDDNSGYCECESCTRVALEEGVDVVLEDGTTVREAR